MTDFRRIYKGTEDLEFELIGAKKDGNQPYLRVARRTGGDDEYLGALEVRNLRRLRDAINLALESPQ